MHEPFRWSLKPAKVSMQNMRQFLLFFRRARKGSRARVRSIYSSRVLLVLYVRLARAAFRLKRLLENKVCSAGLPNWLIGCCKILFRLVFDSLSSVCHMLYLFLIPQEVFFRIYRLDIAFYTYRPENIMIIENYHTSPIIR